LRITKAVMEGVSTEVNVHRDTRWSKYDCFKMKINFEVLLVLCDLYKAVPLKTPKRLK